MLVLLSCTVYAQKSKHPLNSTSGLELQNVAAEAVKFKHKKSVKIYDLDPTKDTEQRLAKLAETDFHNGTIEVELSGDLLKTAGAEARGFVGIAFRIGQDNSSFECIYLRPTNGRAEDQVRRNHAVQYTSFPGFPWFKLRQEFPKKYESYVDLAPGEWIKYKIDIQDATARLYVHGAEQPTLIVTDLKLGETEKGAVALWIGPGTEAHFRNLVITKRD